MTNRINHAKIGVVVIVQNDSETIERSIRSYYDYVDHIIVSTDPKRGFSGKEITQDNTLEIIRSLDINNKIEILENDYYKSSDPMENETLQRQCAVDYLSSNNGYEWILQIDADEVFLDFPSLLNNIINKPTKYAVFWRWITVFNLLDDGRLLIVVDNNNLPLLERFPLGHRRDVKLERARRVMRPRRFINKIFSWKIEGGMSFNDAVLHYSYAKSPQRIKEKLRTFGHSHEFDTDAYYDLWLKSKTDWGSIKNFHPVVPSQWPALRPYTLQELQEIIKT